MELSRNEWELIVHALVAVTPSGGGGAIHSLSTKIAQAQRIEPELRRVLCMQAMATREFTGKE